MLALRKPISRWPKWNASTRRRLQALVKDHGVKLAAFPEDLIAAARQQATGVLGELASRSAITAKVHDSYAAFRAATAPWSRISIEAVLRARGV